MNRIFALLCIALVVSLSMSAIVSAQTSLRNNTIPTQLSSGARLSGTVTILFDDESLEAQLRTNWGQSISIRELLAVNNKQTVIHYNCSNSNCMPHYETQNAVNTIALDGSKEVGFVLEGNSIRNVRDIRLDIEGSSGPSCFPDISVDVLNTGTNIIGSTRYIDQGCYVPRYGCFESERPSYQNVGIPTGSASYCEKITLPAAPAFKIGARVTNSSSGTASLVMKLYKVSGTLLGQCTLPTHTQTEEDLSCIVSRGSLEQDDYFVCINAASASNYRIRAETNAPCGTTDRGVTYAADYEIFAQNLQFDRPSISITDAAFRNSTGYSLLPLVQTYLVDTYGNNCQPNCIVPFRIQGTSQEVTLANAFIRYDSAIGAGVESSSVYEITRENATIDSGALTLDLGLTNFSVPEGFTGRTLQLSIDGRTLLQKSINVSAGFAFGVTPTFAAFGRDTLFTINPSSNITQATWNFGDNSALQTVSGATTRHRYTTQGTYSVVVDVTNNRGQTARRTFNVIVGDPQSAVDDTLALYEGDLASLNGNLSTYPSWLQQELRTRLDTASVSQIVAAARTARASATNESDFIEIMNSLSSVRVPSRVGISARGALPLSVGSENMDISLLTEMQEITIDDATLRNNVLYWMSEHYLPQVNFETYQAYYGDISEPVLTKFVINLNARGQRVPTRLVIGYPADSVHIVSSSRGNDSLSRGVSVNVPDGASSVEFSVIGMVTPQELGAYLVPAQLSDLGDLEAPQPGICNFDDVCSEDENHDNCPNDCKPWGSATAIVVIVIIAGGLVYLVIRLWYAKSYERELFPHRQDLLNVLTFIGNARRANIEDKEIIKKLKAAGWSGEQSKYALDKYNKDTAKPQESKTPAKFIKSAR